VDNVLKEEKESEYWTMYFDEAVKVFGNRAGATIISPNKSNTLFRSSYSLSTLIIQLSINLATSY
jgi:hypothetical protein